MKSFKFFLSFTIFFLSVIGIKAQVLIGSLDLPDESAVLELVAKNGDKGFLGPRVKLTDIWDTVTIRRPATGLLVFNTRDSDPDSIIDIADRVAGNRFYYWTGNEWTELLGENAIKQNIQQALVNGGVGRTALFTLDGKVQLMPNDYPDMKCVFDLLAGVSVNSSVYFPLKEIVNHTENAVTMVDEDDNTTILLKPGVYDIVFGYEFVPGSHMSTPTYPPPGCNNSFYYMEFPINIKNWDNTITRSLVRIDSNNYHNEQWDSYHGGSINYTTVILEDTLWPVKLGRGAGGNCQGVSGFAMPNRSTFLSITRLGDISDAEYVN